MKSFLSWQGVRDEKRQTPRCELGSLRPGQPWGGRGLGPRRVLAPPLSLLRPLDRDTQSGPPWAQRPDVLYNLSSQSTRDLHERAPAAPSRAGRW